MTLCRWLFALAPVLVLSGCVYPVQSPSPPTTNPASSVPLVQSSAVSSETLAALEQLTELKEELKKLRNAVEEIQFHTDNATRRQQNLFQDMDRRLLSLERAQRLVSLPPAVPPANGNVGALPGVTPGGTGAVEVVVGSAGATETPAISTPDAAEEKTVSVEEQEAYDQAFDLLKKSKYQNAISQFRQMAEDWPDSQLADDAYYWMSEALYVNRELEAALSGFRIVAIRYPDSQRVPEALLKIGYIQYDIGAYEDAAEVFRDLLARFPGHQVSVSAQTRLRRIEQTIQ